jgi:unspecific monooxygenase
MRTNALQGWPQRAYEEEVVQRRLFGRSTILLNAPDAIRHVLVDQHENYARTRATLRILRPLLGDGLFISEGQAWRHQRRTLAPAFTPRAVELLVSHILSATRAAVVELIASGPEPLDLFGAV